MRWHGRHSTVDTDTLLALPCVEARAALVASLQQLSLVSRVPSHLNLLALQKCRATQQGSAPGWVSPPTPRAYTMPLAAHFALLIRDSSPRPTQSTPSRGNTGPQSLPSFAMVQVLVMLKHVSCSSHAEAYQLLKPC